MKQITESNRSILVRLRVHHDSRVQRRRSVPPSPVPTLLTVLVTSPLLTLCHRHSSRPQQSRLSKYIRSASPSNVKRNILTEPAFLFIWMGVLMLIFLTCATRTNALYVAIFTTLTLVFVFLAGAYWRLAVADALVGNRLVVVCPSFFCKSHVQWLMLTVVTGSRCVPVRGEHAGFLSPGGAVV
jgi:cell division protein FtsW (lipid II flippase)